MYVVDWMPLEGQYKRMSRCVEDPGGLVEQNVVGHLVRFLNLLLQLRLVGAEPYEPTVSNVDHHSHHHKPVGILYL